MLVLSASGWFAHKMIRFACFERAGLVFLCFLQEHIFEASRPFARHMKSSAKDERKKEGKNAHITVLLNPWGLCAPAKVCCVRVGSGVAAENALRQRPNMWCKGPSRGSEVLQGWLQARWLEDVPSNVWQKIGSDHRWSWDRPNGQHWH